MNTPMQELIEQLKELKAYTAVTHGLERSLPYQTAIDYAETMLEEEKEMLAAVWLDAQVAHQGDAHIKPSDPTFDEYYEETFNTKEK